MYRQHSQHLIFIFKFILREEKAEQSFNTLNTGSKESAPKYPELETVKSNQLIKQEVDEEKTGFDTRNKVMSYLSKVLFNLKEGKTSTLIGSLKNLWHYTH